MTTTNLGDFGYRELDMAADLLKAWANANLPDDFELKGVQIMLNQNSGNVFLVNEEFQVCMKNGEQIEMFYSTPYEGFEGFADDLKSEYENDGENWNEDDIQFLIDNNIIECEENEEE